MFRPAPSLTAAPLSTALPDSWSRPPSSSNRLRLAPGRSYVTARRGRQVVAGVPFQIDGVVEVAGASARFSNVGRTNVHDIPIGTAFDRLHLLAAASRDVNEGVALARIRLRYADGSETEVAIEYGRHVLDWMGARHKGESPLIDPDSRLAWQVEHPAAARRDDSLRLFYMTLANPDPTREVRSLSLISARARGGFMMAALTVGQIDPADRPPDTLTRVEEHFHIEGAPGGETSPERTRLR